MSEKRRHVRIHGSARVAFGSGRKSIEGTATDISSSGMRIVAAIGTDSDTLDSVFVRFPDLDGEVQIPARVTRHVSNGSDRVIGLQFEFEAEAQRALIDSYVRAAKNREIQNHGVAANSRKLPRASCSIASVAADSTEATILSLDNVSTDGFLATYDGQLRIGERLMLEFALPADSRPIQSEVSVVYTERNPFHNRSAAGLRIEAIGEVDRARLRNFIVQASSGGTLRTVHTWIAQQGLKSSFQISDRDLVARYCRLLPATGALLHLIPAHGHEVRTGIVTSFDARQWSMTFQLSTGRPIDPAETTLFGSFVADAGSFFFSAAVTRVSDVAVTCSAPRNLFRSEQRSYGRKILEEGAEFALMLDGPDAREIPARLVDISRRGFLCEFPADQEIIAKLEGLASVYYRISESLGLDSQGEIRHLQTSSVSRNGKAKSLIRIGVEAGVRRCRTVVHRIEDAEWNRLPVYRNEVPFLQLPGAVSTPLRFFDGRGRSLCALLNSVGLDRANGTRPDATVFVLPPAFGKKKEALAPLAAVLMANFAAQGEPLAVIRYDGIDRPGESDNVFHDAERGYEMLQYRISGGRSDLQATLDYVQSSPHFRPSRVVLVTFSMSALDARRVLADPANYGLVDYWISAMGLPAAQTALRNTLGGLDVIGNYKMGIPSGVCGLLGHLVDMDRVAQDLIDQRYAYITDARVDMAAIDVPVLWLYGRHDMWAPAAEVEDIMSVAAPAERETVQIPAGHNLRTSDDALRTFKLIAAQTFRALFDCRPETVDPDKNELLEMIVAERERLEQRQAPEPVQYWRDYLVGRGEPGSGYDFYRNLVHFRRFLQREVELLDVHDGMAVADMGCGTGLFLEQLVQLHGAAAGRPTRTVEVTAVDLVAEALESARRKVDAVLTGAGAPVGWNVNYLQADLEPSRLLPVNDLLNDPDLALPRLRGRIEGLTGSICHELQNDPDGSLGRYARALEDCNQPPAGSNGRPLSIAARQALHDLNLAARYLRGQSGPGTQLPFARLLFGSPAKPLSYGFEDGSFDRINASLFISYLFNPDYAIAEFLRVLRPGGRAVVSSMRPDSDISVIFTEYVGEATRHYDGGSELRDAREMLNEAAELFELEEEGYFRFFDAAELTEMLVRAGFVNVRSERSLGDPPQAVIVVAEKPL
ncbi:MAG: methyltransferase domain-containing protein [Spirochaetaceae bacterium]|nr:MAG: methyltransferase domain-containing protein [Spirochaetaceae bacterium]